MERLSYLETLRAVINTQLDRLTDYPAAVPPRLKEAMRYSLLQGGKRLRPILTLASAEMVGGDPTPAIPAACALEMIHTYSLIHDDLPAMDNDDLRRGNPTSHVKFGEATAILAGDALLTEAFATIARTADESLRAPMTAALAEAAGVFGMIGGQTDDVIGEKNLSGGSAFDDRSALLHSIHKRKTGALIVGAFRLGGLAASADAEQLRALSDCGEAFGLAFQIIDDLLDVTGNEKLLGKRVGKDAALGKLTFPNLLGIDESRAEAARQVEAGRHALDVFAESRAKSAVVEILESTLTRKS
ncbi:MAG: polyprenyl synthetase family protein [Thermoguttaceae bacterium]|nr:polyprenyl synthetase family protein [Thermoguttaceae bacterium]